ncbi:hypothetical protein M5585_15730 [Serratia ureilytica]
MLLNVTISAAGRIRKDAVRQTVRYIPRFARPLGDERLSGLQRLLVVRHRQAIAPLVECRVALGDQRFQAVNKGNACSSFSAMKCLPFSAGLNPPPDASRQGALASCR